MVFMEQVGLNQNPSRLRRLAALPFVRALAALGLIVLLGVIFSGDGAFFKWGTHRDMLRQTSVYGILACGLTLVIISGGIDLSVGSVLGMVAVLFSLFTIHWRWAAPVAIVACLLIGALAGGLSGWIIGRFQMQPFIATLAMMVLARGAAKFFSDGQKISTAIQQPGGAYTYAEIPNIFNFLNSRLLFDNVAVVTVVLLICFVICWIVLSRLRWGRYIYAIGGNEEAARLSGVPALKVKLLTYGLAGLFSAIAGICQAAQEYQGDPEAGISYELSAIAIVVIGGTSLAGGRGNIWLTLLGVMTIGYLEKILSINAVAESSRLMLTGVIIVGAVLLQRGRK
jgi:ribose transport system permease protein